MKRGVLRVVVVIVALCLLTAFAHATATGDFDRLGNPIYSGGDSEVQARAALEQAGVGVSNDATPSLNPDGSVTVDQGPVTLKDGTSVEGANLKIGPDGQVVQEASHVAVEGMLAQGVRDFRPLPDGYEVGAADSLSDQQPHGGGESSVVVTQGVGMRKVAGALCGDRALAVQVGAVFEGDVNDFCVKDDRIEVTHADQVNVLCGTAGWMTRNLNNATMAVDGMIRLNSSRAQSLGVRDCAGSGMNLSLHGPGAGAEFSLDGSQVGLRYATLTVSSTGMMVAEVAEANGSATLVLDKSSHEVVWVRMAPVFTYEFRTKDAATSFGFRAAQAPHDLFIKRAAGQGLPAASVNCSACTVVDLPARTIEIHGVVDYLRRWFRPDGTPLGQDYVAVYHADNALAKAWLHLDPSFTFVDDLFIDGDHPPTVTRVSNYLTVYEETVGTATHRLLGINETLAEKDLAQNIVTAYRTSYSPATMTITENVLNYTRGTFNVVVFPPGHAGIPGLLSGVVAGQALLLAGVLVFRRDRRGQLAVFIVLGLVVLIVLGMAWWIAGGIRLGPPLPADPAYQSYAQGCLDQAADAALRGVAAVGGQQAAPVRAWFDRGARVLPTTDVEATLADQTAKHVTQCLDKLPENFPGVTVSSARMTVTVNINEHDVTFRVHYPLRLARGETRNDLADTMTVVPHELLQTLHLASATAQSERDHAGRIDLDALQAEQARAIFYPNPPSLMAHYYDLRYPKAGEPWAFATSHTRQVMQSP